MDIITPQEFDYHRFAALKVQKRKRGNKGSFLKPVQYLDCVTAFDIETTRLVDVEQAIMYVWQWQFSDWYTVMGRTWEELLDFMHDLSEYISEDREERLVVLVHNLSYEFQFLAGVYDFQPEEVFAIENRKVLKCTMFSRFELRDTYLHSNMSLDAYCKKMGVEHGKITGSFDYSVIRYPWTPLTPDEIAYCQNDVLGLVEAYTAEMLRDNDNLYTMPPTSTGYVRRDAKRAMRSEVWIKNMVREQQPDYETYKILREAFRGGNTHANRAYSGLIVDDVKSADRSSSYPDVLVNCEYPISHFERVETPDFSTLQRLITVRKKAVIMRIAFYDICLTDEFWGCPYIPRDKCRKIINAQYDNGRVLSADYFEISLTDIDLAIITEEYTFSNAVPIDVMAARYGKLPEALTDLCIQYYRSKTELKGVDGQQLYYEKSKNLLNSIYGMMAQDPVKQTIDYVNGQFVEREDDPAELLEKAMQKAFLCYQWGCYVTAWARLRLEEGIRMAGRGFVYCDTDSVKYTGEIDWDKYNTQREHDSRKSGAYATDPQGVQHFMGVYEQEDGYRQFITMGAKKYAYESEYGHIAVTVSGVNKRKGGVELERHGGLKAFKSGFVFHEAGGTESVYNDEPEVKEYYADGRRIPITRNVVIRDSTYTLGITYEYEQLLTTVQKWRIITE